MRQFFGGCVHREVIVSEEGERREGSERVIAVVVPEEVYEEERGCVIPQVLGVLIHNYPM